ncbi:MAG TPA: hypothetical protein VG900_11160 [Hyphomicrobiaceae bacterium]|nr:hypothetical protein [Hyphomicrobiaceae bacterium]
MLWLWLLASLVWVAAVAVVAARGWPHIPLDVSAGDPATRAAYDRAVRAYALRHALAALLPPLALLLAGWLAARLTRG